MSLMTWQFKINNKFGFSSVLWELVDNFVHLMERYGGSKPVDFEPNCF